MNSIFSLLFKLILFSSATEISEKIARQSFNYGIANSNYATACIPLTNSYSAFCYEGYGFKFLDLTSIQIHNLRALNITKKKTFFKTVVLGYGIRLGKESRLDELKFAETTPYDEAKNILHIDQSLSDGYSFGKILWTTKGHETVEKDCKSLSKIENQKSCLFGLGRARFFEKGLRKYDDFSDEYQKTGYHFARSNAGLENLDRTNIFQARAQEIVDLKNDIHKNKELNVCQEKGNHYLICVLRK